MLKSKLIAIFFVLMFPFTALAQSSNLQNVREGYHALMECNAAYIVHYHYIRIYHQYNSYTNAPQNTIIEDMERKIVNNMQRNYRLMMFTGTVLGINKLDKEMHLNYVHNVMLSMLDYPDADASLKGIIRINRECEAFETSVEQMLTAPAPQPE